MATYEVRLDDEFSSPADDVLSSVRAVQDAFEDVVAPVKSAGAAFDSLGFKVNAAGRLVDRHTGRFVKMSSALQGVTKSGAGTTGFFRNLVSQFSGLTVANLAADAIRNAARAALEYAKSAAAAVGQAIGFRQSLTFSLTRFIGDAGSAQKAVREILKVSNQLGLNFQKTGSLFRSLVSAGATKEAALELIRLKADVIALGDGSSESLMRIDEAFKQIEKAMATGKIELDQFTSILSNLPVTQLQVMEKLAPKIGKKTSDLIDKYGKLKVEIGKLPVDKLLEGVPGSHPRSNRVWQGWTGRHGQGLRDAAGSTGVHQEPLRQPARRARRSDGRRPQ